ncbi:MAG: peptidoglycan DD-metalloendopeptidase family protein [Pseudomonadota bacterium]|nr:peptidoglycan DD-metalloendopeptidase family protein [Pseudomonadota bacterium]
MPDVTVKLRRGLLLSLGLWACAGVVAAAQEREQAERDLSEISAAIADIQAWLRQATTRETEQESALRETQLALSDAQQALAEQTQALAAARADQQSLQQQSRELLASKREQEQVLAALLRHAYINRKDNALKSLLNAESLSEGARQLQYTRYLSEFQLDRIETFNATLSELTALDAEVAQNLSLMVRQQQRAIRFEKELEQARESQAAALAELRNSIASHSSAMTQLKTQQSELQQLIEEITRALEGVSSFDQITPLADSRGKLPPPVDEPVAHAFGASYGGGSLVRKGLSYSPNPGKPVRAVHAGRVVFADWLRGSGLLIVLDHGQGFISLYGHNEALTVNGGDWVDAGEVLARSGINSSDRTAGLYFEIRRNGEPQDPTAWLR